MAVSYLNRWATVAGTANQYRYDLGRRWEDIKKPRAVFIMLNPSTADGTDDDATVRRCVGFARSWGCGSLVVVNLFAYRATNPVDMKRVPDPVGPENDDFISGWVASRPGSGWDRMAVAAWGDHGIFRQRDLAVRRMLRDLGVPLFHLGLTAAGNPKHPVRLAGATPLTEWR